MRKVIKSIAGRPLVIYNNLNRAPKMKTCNCQVSFVETENGYRVEIVKHFISRVDAQKEFNEFVRG